MEEAEFDEMEFEEAEVSQGEFPQFFASLGKEGDVIRVFEQENGDYTLHGNRAEKVAEQFAMQKNLRSVDKLPTLTIPLSKIEAILRSFKSSCTIELYQKSDSDWMCVKVVPAGSDVLFSELFSADSFVQVAIYKEKLGNSQFNLGVALIDVSKKWCGVLVIPCGQSEWQKLLGDALSTYLVSNLTVCAGDWNEEDSLYLSETYKNITVCKKNSFAFDRSSNKIVVKDIGSDLPYCSLTALTQDLPSISGFTVESVKLSSRMRLDKVALRALNVFPVSTDRNKQSSVFGILSKCKTAMGSRKLTSWLCNPLINLEEIQRRLDFVEIFTADTELRQSTEDQFKRIPDIDRINGKLSKRSASIQDCVNLYNMVEQLPVIFGIFENYSGTQRNLWENDVLAPLRKFCEDLKPLSEMIEQTIDLEAVERHEYIINANFSKELKEISSEKNAVLKDIQRVLEDIKREFKVDVKLNHNGVSGYHLKVTRKDEKAIRGSDRVIIIETKKDGVKFSTHKLKPLSKSYSEFARTYDKLQDEVVKKVIDIVASYLPVLEEVSTYISQLDVLLGFAVASCCAPILYCRPQMLPMGAGILKMNGARHPCLEYTSDCCIPNDVMLNKGENVQIITGPNMGGKSTYIRTIATIVLMAQIGCFIPASAAQISIVDCILARVGAGDSQLAGVSTFMAEMLETSHILKTSTSNSLLIIDELGRGTSTYEGYGLAYAIAEHIACKIHAYALFATHFHELSRLAVNVPCVVNKHVTAHTDSNTITMLYKVQPGFCERSFGVQVAEMVLFPSAVIDSAKRKVAELEGFECDVEQNGESDKSSPKRNKLFDQKRDFIRDFNSLNLPESDDLVLSELKCLASKYGLL